MKPGHFTAKIFFGSLSLIVLTVALDCKWNVLPIGGLILLFYVLIVLCLTVWVTSKALNRVLSQNKPFVYDFENNPYLKHLKCYLFKVKPIGMDEVDSGKRLKSIDDRIDDFTRDVEVLIRRWFSLISRDETFLKESRNLVDDVVRRFLQVVIEVDAKRLSHGILVIFLNHVKEYQKTVKRQKKKSGSVEELYRYAHIASNNEKTFEHVISRLTNKLFRQFISWEVYNSVPCSAVVSVVAKRLTAYVLIYVTSPTFVNYKLASVCSTSDRKVIIKLDSFDAISLTNVDLSRSISKQPNISRAKEKPMVKESSKSNTPRVSPKKSNGEKREDETDMRKPISAPVKIYESKSSDKTWRNSSDLECISLGQDLLVLEDFSDPDSGIQTLIGKKLWKDNSDFAESEPSLEEPVDIAKDLPSFISNTIKPIGNATATTFHELQQTTVNSVVKPVSQATSSAMHRIGDFQDEAAGVMEGIFDFGMAGIRKGLRLTGLQDGNEKLLKPKPISADPSPNDPKSLKRLTKLPPVNSEDSSKSDENVWVNPLTGDSPNFDGHILLEKPVPSISMEEQNESPDLEYEDTTDLATTTAKLRSLLQQKTSESNLTTPAISPMPVDETGQSASNDYPSSSIEDLTAVDGALPSLYKFCARTATGVFHNTLNTLKTALPGNAADQESAKQDLLDYDDVDNWTYVASDLTQDDLTVRVEKLLNERKAFCVVDNAYEAVESLDVLDHTESGWNTPTRKRFLVDDLDELEIHIPLTKTLVDIFCESSEFLVPETVVKLLLILCGSITEEYVSNFAKKTLRRISSLVGNLPTGSQQKPLALSIEDFTEIFLDGIPGILKYVVGEEVFISTVKTLLSSLQSQKINQDIALQIFELFTSLLIEANSKLSPAYSA